MPWRVAWILPLQAYVMMLMHWPWYPKRGIIKIHDYSRNKIAMRVFALFLLAASLAFAEDVTLNDDAILNMVKGKRLGATSPARTSFRLTFKDDGTLAGNEGHTVDKGTWRVEGGKLCITWEKWKYDGCGKLVKTGNEVKFSYPAQDDKIYLTFN